MARIRRKRAQPPVAASAYRTLDVPFDEARLAAEELRSADQQLLAAAGPLDQVRRALARASVDGHVGVMRGDVRAAVRASEDLALSAAVELDRATRRLGIDRISGPLISLPAVRFGRPLLSPRTRRWVPAYMRTWRNPWFALFKRSLWYDVGDILDSLAGVREVIRRVFAETLLLHAGLEAICAPLPELDGALDVVIVDDFER